MNHINAILISRPANAGPLGTAMAGFRAGIAGGSITGRAAASAHRESAKSQAGLAQVARARCPRKGPTRPGAGCRRHS